MADKKAEVKKAASKKTESKKADSKKAVKNKKPNVFRRLLKYLSSCKGEIKKITWPTPAQTTKNFGIVIAVLVVMGLFIFGLDSGLYAILGLIMGTGSAT